MEFVSRISVLGARIGTLIWDFQLASGPTGNIQLTASECNAYEHQTSP